MNCVVEGRILLVGEGDFSFSVAMVNFISPKNRKIMVSTSIETEESIQKHSAAMENIELLKREGVTVLLETDATMLHVDLRLINEKFDRIVFNFPHSGGKSNHKKNRKLLSDFFTSAVNNLSEKGQVLMSLCKGQGGTPADKPMRAWPDSWQVVSMAANAGLILREVWPFVSSDFPEYSCTGFRSQDKGFNTEGAITHVFTRGEVVKIPERPDINSTISSNIQRQLLQGDHPVAQINKILEDNLSRFFCTEFCHAPDPVLDDVSMVSMDTVMSHDNNTWKDLPAYFYKVEGNPEESEVQNFEMHSFVDFWKMKRNMKTKPGEESCKSESENLCEKHLRFSMLEHYQDLLELIVDDFDNQATNNSESDRETSSGAVAKDTDKDCISGKLRLNSMAGQVIKPCDINPNTSSVSMEMIGVIGSSCSDVKVTTVCDLLYKSLNQISSNMIISLQLDKNRSKNNGEIYKMGTIELSGCDSQTTSTDKHTTKTELCQFWFHKMTSSTGKVMENVIFLIDLTLLCKSVFQLPCTELLFSDIVDFSKQCQIKDNVFHYTPISVYPVIYNHDMSFWENEKEEFNELAFLDVIRSVAKDSILTVSLLDSYVCETSGRKSRCYRLQFQSHDKVLSYNTSWKLQSVIRLEVAKVLNIILR